MTAGLYIHIPFCCRKCIYCDFYSITDLSLTERFLRALTKEMELLGEQEPFSRIEFSTIYLGGGTPSLLEPKSIETILRYAFAGFRFCPEVEISLEANPESASLERLRGFRTAGITRLTIGVQSFVDNELRLLSRIHNAAQAETAVQAARQAGFDNIGIDLIFGIPGQTFSTWEVTLKRALFFQPEHLSVYSLTFEPETLLWRKRQTKAVEACSEELESQFFLYAAEQLSQAGYEHYEISNYAKPGKRSMHNQMYWEHAPYLGLGPSAHSFDGQKRRWNFRNLDLYFTTVEAMKLPTEGEEIISSAVRAKETVMLRLRQKEGIDLQRWADDFGYDLLPIARQIAASTGGIDDMPLFAVSPRRLLLTCRDKRLGLTRQGILLYDSLCSEFFFRLPAEKIDVMNSGTF